VNLLEKNILERLHAGDENAFEYIFRTYYPVLLKYAVQISRDEVAGEEAVEKTLINLWEGRLTIHIGISLKAYLFKSVFNHCLNSIKHWQIKERYLLYFRYHTATDDSGSIISDEYPLSRVLENELEQVLEKAINCLPHQCREVFMLSRYDNLKNDAIAEKLNISVNTVRTQISRALARLREELKEYMG